MNEKLKSLLSDDAFFYAILLILVGMVSFALGRYSVIGELPNRISDNNKTGIVFVNAATDTSPAFFTVENRFVESNTKNIKVMASSKGTRYYPLDCKAGKRIKEENRIFFASPALAEAAGYLPAANCPGLR